MEFQQMSACRICPRACGADRAAGQAGYCGVGGRVQVARAALHYWEEPCLSGTAGSGAVFFSGCNMKCVFCQNFEINREYAGQDISVGRLCQIFLELQAQGALNINLVTPTHYVPQIAGALTMARQAGLHLPVVYNSSCYELPETLALLRGLVDIYLPDLKYVSGELSARYSGAPDYFARASAALAEMVAQAPAPLFDEKGIMRRGVIVRHLMLPGALFDSKKVVEYLYATYGDNIYISIMNQYTPNGRLAAFPEIDRPLPEKHYQMLVDYALELGVKNGFVQQGGTVSESFIPPFDLTGV